MFDRATYRLLSIETEVARPRVLAEGSLAACLDALKDVVLSDVIAANRGALAITAFMPDERPVEVLSAHTTGSGY